MYRITRNGSFERTALQQKERARTHLLCPWQAPPPARRRCILSVRLSERKPPDRTRPPHRQQALTIHHAVPFLPLSVSVITTADKTMERTAEGPGSERRPLHPYVAVVASGSRIDALSTSSANSGQYRQSPLDDAAAFVCFADWLISQDGLFTWFRPKSRPRRKIVRTAQCRSLPPGFPPGTCRCNLYTVTTNRLQGEAVKREQGTHYERLHRKLRREPYF